MGPTQTQTGTEQRRRPGGWTEQIVLSGVFPEHSTHETLELPVPAKCPGQVEVMPEGGPNSEWTGGSTVVPAVFCFQAEQKS